MPNYELIAKFYTKHSSAQARSLILQPCDFRNQKIQAAASPKTNSPATSAVQQALQRIYLGKWIVGSWRGQKTACRACTQQQVIHSGCV